jgi:hypothetical protein
MVDKRNVNAREELWYLLKGKVKRRACEVNPLVSPKRPVSAGSVRIVQSHYFGIVRQEFSVDRIKWLQTDQTLLLLVEKSKLIASRVDILDDCDVAIHLNIGRARVPFSLHRLLLRGYLMKLSCHVLLFWYL